NQQQFTEAEPDTIPTIAVVEEAQSVLTGRDGASAPYIEWVKEGRKYDLGALLITQQPGSIPVEILSQGDNWFIFHLLSSADLIALKRANSHFSDDLLSSLLNEPIPGHGVFWSSVGGKPYPISLRAESFEAKYEVGDPTYSREPAGAFAREIPGLLAGSIGPRTSAEYGSPTSGSGQSHQRAGSEQLRDRTVSQGEREQPTADEGDDAEPVDEYSAIRQKAVDSFK